MGVATTPSPLVRYVTKNEKQNKTKQNKKQKQKQKKKQEKELESDAISFKITCVIAIAKQLTRYSRKISLKVYFFLKTNIFTFFIQEREIKQKKKIKQAKSLQNTLIQSLTASLCIF